MDKNKKMSLNHAGDRMIPTTTVLPLDKLPMLKNAVEWREKELRHIRYNGGIEKAERSLWLMEELEHLRELLKTNEEHHKNEK